MLLQGRERTSTSLPPQSSRCAQCTGSSGSRRQTSRSSMWATQPASARRRAPMVETPLAFSGTLCPCSLRSQEATVGPYDNAGPDTADSMGRLSYPAGHASCKHSLQKLVLSTLTACFHSCCAAAQQASICNYHFAHPRAAHLTTIHDHLHACVMRQPTLLLPLLMMAKPAGGSTSQLWCQVLLLAPNNNVLPTDITVLHSTCSSLEYVLLQM